MGTIMSRQLTADEEDRQRRYGEYHRDVLREVVSDLIGAHGADASVGVFCSGGMDSTSIVWSLIEQGVRPDIYTIAVPDEDGEVAQSMDHKRARQIANSYDLRFHPVRMPDDPEELVALMENAYRLSGWTFNRRADFEVMAMFYRMTVAAAEHGNTVVYTGLLDNSLHLEGGKTERRNRYLETVESTYVCDMLRAQKAMTPRGPDNGQYNCLVGMGLDQNVQIVAPHMYVSWTLPYWNVSWRMTNSPRMKRISSSAFGAEIAESGFEPTSNAMQSGKDTGIRDYFDRMTNAAAAAREWYGFEPGESVSSTRLLNRLVDALPAYEEGDVDVDENADTAPDDEAIISAPAAYGDPNPDRALAWMSAVHPDNELSTAYHDARVDPYFSYLGDDGLLTDKAVEEMSVRAARWNEGSTISDEEPQRLLKYADDPFAAPAQRESMPRERMTLLHNDSGEIRREVDCYGNPLASGPQHSYSMCARARAGLCGLPDSAHQSRPGSCAVFHSMSNDKLSGIDSEPLDHLSDTLRVVHDKWLAILHETITQVKEGALELL